MAETARSLLKEGKYDLAVLLAEYAAQLYLKQLLYRLTGEEWRGHNIRALLGVLAMTLREEGLESLAVEVESYASRHRRILAELEEAYVRSVYGPFPYSGEQASALVEAAESLIALLGRIESHAFEEADKA
jgi:HEPN domain-containing protein